MATAGIKETRFDALELYEPSTFVQKLEERLGPFFEAATVVQKAYILEQGKNFINTLPYRILNEKSIADTCAVDLLEMGELDDFEVKEFVFVSRQLEDEARHFMMLAKIYEAHTKKKVIPNQIKPLKTQSEKFDPLKRKGEFIRRAANRFAGEGFAYNAAKTTYEMLSGDIGDAYRIISKDEYFHKRLGQLLLERHALSPNKRSAIEEIVMERAKGTIKMYMEIYGYNEEAAEIYRSHFGEL